MRYKIYDDAFNKFDSEPQGQQFSKHGLAIGQIMIKSIGNLDLLKWMFKRR